MTFNIPLAGYDENASGGTLIPNGDYPVALKEWEDKENSKQTGRLIKAQFMIMEGSQENRIVFENYSYQNPSPETVKIAGENLKQLVIACGYDGNTDLTPELLESLKGRVFVAKVGVSKAKKDSGFDDSNAIKKYTRMDLYQATAQQPAATAAPSAPAAPVAPAATAPAAPAAAMPPPVAAAAPPPPVPAAAPAPAPAQPAAAPAGASPDMPWMNT